ncbi:hypothetical protein HPB48_026858 [Haemaphysalis longicornis]|uniref:Peptidase M13 N-terminal domain-containing protein n=1 Tax=Haemaphysalis longicornis TaxID=44386 RepID=A0A9J6HBU4_HAELO|nr:hypothetical protein HPB48_026858 [Haemaphysalis longicornis]
MVDQQGNSVTSGTILTTYPEVAEEAAMALAIATTEAKIIVSYSKIAIRNFRRSETSPRRPLLIEQEMERPRGIVKEVVARTAAVLVLASVGVTVAVHQFFWPPVATFPPSPPPSKDHVVLQTIYKVMDTKQDPCKEFYAFVCGNYKSPYGSMLANMEGDMYESLHDIIDYFRVSFLIRNNPFASEKAASLHKQCRVGQRLFEEELLRLFLKHERLDSSSYAKRKTLDTVLMLFFKYNINTLLGLSLEEPLLHDSKRRLRVSLNEKQLSWFSIRQGPAGIVFYKNTLDYRTEEIVQVENEAAGRITEDVLRGLNNISFDTVLGLEILTPTVNQTGGRWTKLVEAHTKNSYLRDYPVLVSRSAMQYFDKLYADLGNKKLCLLTAWALARKLLPVASEKVESFLTEDTFAAWCRETVLETMEVPLMSWYLFPRVSSKELRHSSKITQQIQHSILQQIENSRWIDNYTRQVAFHKIRNATIHIGYPKNLASHEAIDKAYHWYPTAWDKFMTRWLHAMKLTAKNLLQNATTFRLAF